MDTLIAKLKKLEKQNYRAYQQIKGSFDFKDFQLIFDHIQADPYAGDSRIRAIRPWSVTGLEWLQSKSNAYQVAARDYISRSFAKFIKQANTLSIATTGAVVLDNSAVLFTEDGIELRFRVKLPADGRLILAKKAINLLTFNLPKVIRKCTLHRELDIPDLQRHCTVIEDQQALRNQLASQGLIAFIANGSILPRAAGNSFLPMSDATPFQAPDSLSVTLETPNHGKITGMGITQGVTLIVGGGFHGKSTLLSAIEEGVYDHVPGDGREYVVTHMDAVKIKAEDGRSIKSLNLSNFINHLPKEQTVTDFSTKDASGSTSQAAWLQESIDAGASALLIDEDTSATNFMIRDQRMQALVAKSAEPITPLVDRVTEMHHKHGLSTIIVMGGSGDYLDVADTVIQMHEYQAINVTDKAKQVIKQLPSSRQIESEQPFLAFKPRAVHALGLMKTLQQGKMRVNGKSGKQIRFGNDYIDLSALEQLQSTNELHAIGWCLLLIAQQDGWVELSKASIENMLQGNWRAQLLPNGDIALPRTIDILSALNRYREASIKSLGHRSD